ncbi:OLC1v1037391C2 [Oldenlandia corymbosa var. corymbosa]|uniref:OLC1v1037391C2 n=1 Tax=Oldenlandia corymbosa var. corymbosa TaxID=529605 RepID=A0AAV1CYX1_OLDCO|nr:OLC1v1037391C2 [Oldenlandia corymbosa var. corymbosa]
MGSGYYGQPNLGNERSSSSSRKSGSKKGNSDKPKQPQRGLGVAQLEKIRLHSQMGCTSFPPPSLHHHHHHHNPYATHNLSQEDIRMQTPYSSSSSFSYSTPSSSSSSYGFQAPMGGYGDYEGITHIRYGDSQPTTTTRWPPGNTVIDYTQQYAQPGMTRQLLDLQAEESYGKRKKKHGSESSSQNSESSGNNQDLDLELRLSL